MDMNRNVEMLQSLTGENDKSIICTYLLLAENRLLRHLYPFTDSKMSVPDKYALKVVEIAQYLYLRRGSEGELSHSENGVSRTYEGADIPKSMLKDVLPMVGVVK